MSLVNVTVCSQLAGGGTGRPLLIVPHMHAYVVDISRWMVRGVSALPVARMMASCVRGCMVVCHGDMVGHPVLYNCMEHVCPCDIVSDVCFRSSARVMKFPPMGAPVPNSTS